MAKANPLQERLLKAGLVEKAKVRERDTSLIMIGHGRKAGAESAVSTSEDDANLAQVKVPADMTW